MFLNICKEVVWGSRESVLFAISVSRVNKTPAIGEGSEGRTIKNKIVLLFCTRHSQNSIVHNLQHNQIINLIRALFYLKPFKKRLYRVRQQRRRSTQKRRTGLAPSIDRQFEHLLIRASLTAVIHRVKHIFVITVHVRQLALIRPYSSIPLFLFDVLSIDKILWYIFFFLQVLWNFL